MVKAETPLIGLTTYRQDAAWGPWNRSAALVPTAYVDCVAAVGGHPMLLPPSQGAGGADESATAVIGVLDGLVLIGGGDVDPDRYQGPPDPTTAGVNPRRDESEFALLAAALALDVPVLAICRGMQVLNVHLGGNLIQHLPDAVGHAGHQPAAGCFGTTEVRIEPGSRLSKILDQSVTVRCSHHQAVERLGVGLVASAWAPDGVVEAVELSSAPFVIGVEWHPEEDGDLRLFDALIHASR
jgi:putative glutamine amidotransferase